MLHPNAREIRVFLSSPFRDMNAERDHLLKHVFPEFRRACAERDVSFVEIDLRWGVTEEESRNGKTVEICLAEIDRCRDYPPFFVGFMGERYGWIPEEHELAAYWEAHGGSPYAAPIRRALEQRICVTELEMQFAVFDHPGGPQAVNAHFFLRDRALTEQLFQASGAPEADFFDHKAAELQRLRERIRNSGLVAVDGYRTLEAFGESVRALLQAGLDERYPLASVPSPAQRRAQAHAQFAASRRPGYVPLPAMQDAVAQVLAAAVAAAPEQRRHLYVSGPSGVGKSAFMAALETWLPERFPGSMALAFYCGADGAPDLSLWRDDLAERLGAQVEAGQAGDEKARWDRLAGALDLARAAVGGPLFLLIDAVDQLDAPDQTLRTLAAQPWPGGVVAIVSGLPEVKPDSGYAIAELAPAMPEHRQAMIESFNARYRKALAPALAARLAHDERTGSPLFLHMVLEQLRVHARHETLASDVEAMLALPDADALFRHLLARWDDDFGDANHPDPVSRLAGLLALSRNGLDENELADLLAAPNDPVSPATGKPRLPAARLSPLLAVLRPYLLRHEGRERLMHAALARGATPPAPIAVRIVLIRYFEHGDAARVISERLYQALRLVQDAPQDNERLDLLMRIFWWIATVYRLSDADMPLAREALAALGAASPAGDTRAARLGRTWAEQLRQYQAPTERGVVRRTLGWLRRQAGRAPRSRPEPQGLYPTCAWVEYLAEWAFLVPALPLAEAAAAIAADAGPGQTPLLPRCLQAVAALHLRAGRHEAARACADKALAASRANGVTEAQGPVLHDLALSLHLQGRSEEALAKIGEALVLLRAEAPESGAVANALGLQGLVLAALERYDLAEAVALEAQAMRVRVLMPGDQSLALGQIELAQVYSASGQVDRAIASYEDALASLHRTLPAGHPILATTQTDLGNLYREQGRVREALPLLTNALALHRAAFDAGHPDLCRDLNNLGLLRQDMGDLAGARVLFDEGLEIARRAMPPGHHFRLQSLINTALCYEALELVDQAGALLEEALAEGGAALPPAHPSLTNVMGQLGFVREQQGRWDEAERLQTEVLARWRASLPAGHPQIADTLVRCAAIDVHAERFAHAEAAFTEALTILRAAYPNGNLDTAYALNNFGGACVAAGEPAKAVPLFDEALALVRRLLPPGHPFLIVSIHALGMACQGAGQTYRAQACMSELQRLHSIAAA